MFAFRPTRPRLGALASVLVVAALAGVAVASFAPRGQAGQVARTARLTTISCGMSITTSTTASNDLSCGSATGLFVTGSNVTLNLNGHKITGTNGPAGIQVTGAHSTVKNGSVSGFQNGVKVLGSDSTVSGMHVEFPILAGIELSGLRDRATGNTVWGSGAATGIHGSAADQQFTGNTVRNNDTGGISAAGTGAVVSGNKAENNDASGIIVTGNDSTVTGNAADGNTSFGLFVPTDRATVTKNTAHFNKSDGIWAGNGGVTDGGGNKAGDNDTLEQCNGVLCS